MSSASISPATARVYAGALANTIARNGWAWVDAHVLDTYHTPIVRELVASYGMTPARTFPKLRAQLQAHFGCVA